MLQAIANAEALVEQLLAAARANPGLPVSIVADAQGDVQVGLLGLVYLADEDWYYLPVPLTEFRYPERFGDSDPVGD